MKRAVLYARVSGDLQAKEGTIESQVLALRKQIAAAGHEIVREYIDDGYPGARLDRPALNEMRRDVKTPLFDAIYFLDADRIARDVTIQTIIIEEILKHRKQLVINGKDYVKNPENKFTLTVLGAVAELERAKIVERVTRGKQLRLSQGQLLGCGVHTFGYDYLRKTPTSAPRMIVNEREAEIVRYVFEKYAGSQIGMDRIARQLEERGALTKKGNTLWRRSFLKTVLRNETYLGVKYFNTMRCVREYANPIYDIKHSSQKRFRRGREEWIGIEVPAIISRELFDRVQARREANRKRYRNPKQVQLLSSLVRCGSCGGSVFAMRRWERSPRKGPLRVVHKVAYKCNWGYRGRLHSEGAEIDSEFVGGRPRPHPDVETAFQQKRLSGVRLRDMDLDLALTRAGIAPYRAQHLHERALRMMRDRRFGDGAIAKPPARLASCDAQVRERLTAVEGLDGDDACDDFPQRRALQRVFNERSEILEPNGPPDASAELAVAAQLRSEIVDLVHHRERQERREQIIRENKSRVAAQPLQRLCALFGPDDLK